MKRLIWLVVIGGVLLAVLLLASSFISPFGWGRGSGGYGPWMMGRGIASYGSWLGDWGFPFMGIMMGIMVLGMLLPLVLVIGGVVWLVQSLARSSGSRSIPLQGVSPFDILKKRYSQGEITKERFEEMKGDLGL